MRLAAVCDLRYEGEASPVSWPDSAGANSERYSSSVLGSPAAREPGCSSGAKNRVSFSSGM